MSATIVSSVESIHRNMEADVTASTKRKNAQLTQEELNALRGMDEKSNENIFLISARKSHRLKTVKNIENLDNEAEDEEAEYDSFWVETGKTRLGLQFERFI